jgi:hypothetical protein
MKKLFCSYLLMVGVLNSCTYSVTLSHSHAEGGSSETLDETQSPQNDIKPNLSIPMGGI